MEKWYTTTIIGESRQYTQRVLVEDIFIHRNYRFGVNFEKIIVNNRGKECLSVTEYSTGWNILVPTTKKKHAQKELKKVIDERWDEFIPLVIRSTHVNNFILWN